MAVGREEAAIVLEPGSATDRILRKGTMTAMQSLSDAPLTATLGGAAMPRFQDAHDQRAGAAAAAREFEDEVSNPSDDPLARPGRARHTPSGLHQLSRRYRGARRRPLVGHVHRAPSLCRTSDPPPSGARRRPGPRACRAPAPRRGAGTPSSRRSSRRPR